MVCHVLLNTAFIVTFVTNTFILFYTLINITPDEDWRQVNVAMPTAQRGMADIYSPLKRILLANSVDHNCPSSRSKGLLGYIQNCALRSIIL